MRTHQIGRAVIGALATIVVVALAASCGGSTKSDSNASSNDTVSRANKGVVENSDKPKPGGKLVYGLYSETNGWNPATNQWAPSGLQVTHSIFDTVTAYDENSEIKPFLAQSFDHNPDFTEWTFTLRPNIKLTNGKPANADVVVRNQNYLMKSQITGPAYAYSNVKAITKKDDLSFVVSLSKPSANWPIALATQLGVVADPDWLESNDGLKPIGTGPFILDKWEIDKQLTVKKNPNYWQKDTYGNQLPYLDSVEFRIIVDDDSRSAAIRAKDIDVLETVSGQQLQQFQTLDGYQVFSDTKGESRESFIQLNTMAAPFDDLDARLALAYATDKKSYADEVSGGFEEVANGPMSPSSPWYVDSGYPQYDLAKAKEYVDKVKAKHGGKFEFTVTGISDKQGQQGLQILQAQWLEAGIDMKIDLTEGAKLIINVIAGSYQAANWSQFDSPNPYADGVWWDPKGAVPPPAFTLNFARNKDEAIGAALVEGGATPDKEKEKAAMATVQKRLSADVPYVWLTHIRVSLIASNNVVNLTSWRLPNRDNVTDAEKGLDLHQGAHPLYQVWLQS